MLFISESRSGSRHLQKSCVRVEKEESKLFTIPAHFAIVAEFHLK